MCRFLILLFIVLAIFLGIATIFGFDALLWPMIFGVVGAPLALLLLPKKGVQHAFRNLYRKLVFYIVVILTIVFIGGLFIIAEFLPADAPEWVTNTGVVVLIVFCLLISFLVIRPYYPLTQSERWFRRKFPLVRDSFHRYKRDHESTEITHPILNINDKRYFLNSYTSHKDPNVVKGYLLLDYGGKPVIDNELIKKAAKAHTLAVSTIDYTLAQNRVRLISDSNDAKAGLDLMFQRLKEYRENSTDVEPQFENDLDQLFSAEQALDQVADATIEISFHEAKWAKNHGLGKLTEIDYRDVEKFEEEIRQIRRPMVEGIPKVLKAAESARRLAEAIERGHISIIQSHIVKEALLGVYEGSGEINPQNEDVYGTMTDELWQAWRDRMEYVKKVDAGLVEAGA
jgi:hypothetical protein